MSDFTLTQDQVNQLTQIYNDQLQRQPQDQQWGEAYNLIYNAIQDSSVNDGVKFFFQNAGGVNGDDATAATNVFVRAAYQQAAALQGYDLNDTQIQAVSGNIGSSVIRSILNDSTVPGSIDPIVDNDVIASISSIPGVPQTLSPATWGRRSVCRK